MRICFIRLPSALAAFDLGLEPRDEGVRRITRHGDQLGDAGIVFKLNAIR